jgi:hypothetical protein
MPSRRAAVSATPFAAALAAVLCSAGLVLAAGTITSATNTSNDPFVACTVGASPVDLQYERASDPWVSFGPGAPGSPSGTTAYAVSISFNQSPGRNGNTVGAAVSYDGGSSWVHPQSLRGDAATGVPLPVPDSNFQFFHDKESVTADPTQPGHAYAVWDVLIGPNMNVEADLHSASFTDFTLLSKTTDFGVTWSPARTNEVPAPVRTGDITPSPAVGLRGDLLVVWQDSRFSGRDEIVISMSADGGATWTAPRRVNTPTGQPAFTASVAVSSSGTIGVSYYQLGSTSPGSMPTSYLLKKFSTSAIISGGIDQGIAQTLIAGPFNMLDAPFALGYFTGDYEALATIGDRFVPVFAQGTCGPSLSCSALTRVTPPADRTPTGANSTDVYVGTGF